MTEQANTSAAPSAGASPRLDVRHGLRLVDRFTLDADGLTVGRGSACDVILPNRAISRQHARVERRGDGWYIIDQRSRNGLRIDGRRRLSAKLTDGAVIEIGPYTLHFRDVQSQATSTAGMSFVDDQTLRTRATLAPNAAPPGARLEELYALARGILQRDEAADVWSQLHATLSRTLGAPQCAVLGLGDEGDVYRVAPRELSADAPPVSRTVIASVQEQQQGLLIESVMADQRWEQAVSLAGSGTSSVLCVPVVAGDRTQSIVYLGRRTGMAPFTEDDLRFAMAAADLAAATIAVDELNSRSRELAHLHGRIEIAREMQALLLPDPLPQPAWGALAARNDPAETMSGDTYDVHVAEDGTLTAMLADVSGKGVPAAFLTTLLHNVFATHAHAPLERIGAEMNAAVLPLADAAVFATILILRVSADGKAIELINGGHHAPLWRMRDGTVSAEGERLGLPLGVAHPWNGRAQQRTADNLHAVVLYSDGVNETHNARGEEFGHQRAIDWLRKTDVTDASGMLETLCHQVRRFAAPAPPGDDVTALAMVWK